MSITFPRDLIEPFRVRSCTFEPMEIEARNAARGGQIQIVSLGPTVWSIKYESVPLLEADAAAWEAWLSSLRGGLRTFKAWHPLRRYARAYPAGYGGLTRHGGGSFDGTATRSTIGAGLDTVLLTGLPSTFAVKVGDMVSWAHSATNQALHRVVEDATASAGQVTLAVEPLIRPSPTGTVASLEKAWCHAVLDRTAGGIRWSPATRTAVLTLQATQTL